MTAIHGYAAAEMGGKGIILCGREWMNSLKDSSMAEVKDAIESEPWLKAYYDVGLEYIRSKNRRIEYVFTGLNRNLDSLKSKSKILVAWIDEAEGVSEMGWNKLEPTLREEGSELWVTWNPEIDGSPTDVRFRKQAHMLEGNSMIVEMNYRDNPWFPQPLEALRQRQQKTLDPSTYAWIWDGAYRQNSEAQVLNGKFRVDDFVPGPNWDGPYFGLDFGFAQDPTAGVKMWVHDQRLFVEYESYAQALELDHTPERLIKDLPGIVDHVCRADNARPESISYLKRHGLPRMRACEKGKGSVEDGIAHLKSYTEIVIHSRCNHFFDECLRYSYKVDRLSGDVLPVLVDAHNHLIDAARYGLEPIMKSKGKGFFG
jgi:phage terminase large subunit